MLAHMYKYLVLALLCGCMSDTSVDVAADAEELTGCPFTRWNTLEYGARTRGWPSDAHGSDCVLVANASDIGAGSSYICAKSGAGQPDYACVFIPRQVAGCTMQAYWRASSEGSCRGAWTHYRCDGYSQDACWTD